jgi:hypothetical protein
MSGLFSSSTLVLLLIALGVFVWLTAKSKSVKTFQFQISLFIVIWVIGEILDFVSEDGAIALFSDSEIGMYVHILAMLMFSAMLWTRYYLSKKRGVKMIDSLQDG